MAEDVHQRYRDYLGGGGSSLPRRVTVEISSRCNLACLMCPRNYLKDRGDFKQGDMNPELFRKIIDEMAAYPERSLVPFFRGESLLHPRFTELMAYAVARGVGPIQLATNAMLLTPEISRELIRLPLDFISFSLDARGKESYEDIRRGASYEQVLANIETFLRLRREKGAVKPVVQVSAVRTARNRELIADFAAHWRTKVERVRIYPEHSEGGRFGSLEGAAAGRPARRPCLKPLTDTVVYWNGEVGICNHDWVGESGLGDVGRRSLADIWRGPAYHALRLAHWENRILPESPCFHCDHWRAYYSDTHIIGELYEE